MYVIGAFSGFIVGLVVGFLVAALLWIAFRSRTGGSKWSAMSIECMDCGCDYEHPCRDLDGMPCGWAWADKVSGLGLCTRCERFQAARGD